MNRDMQRQLANVIGFVAVIIVNSAASIIPINGMDTGQISDTFDVFFVPAGYVFSIWGVIYLGLLGFTVYQALPSQRTNPRLQRIGYLFFANCVFNVSWIFLWHYLVFPLTLVAMLGILATLIAIYLRLRVGIKKVSRAEQWLVNIPFSIYMGWISVATIANFTTLLDFWGWEGGPLSPAAWAAVMLVAGVIIATAMALTRGDIAYLAVFVWAFVGIGVKHADTALVANTAWITAVAVAVLLVIAAVNWQRSDSPILPA